MGSYDTVHAGYRCGQTKALGKGLRNLTLGDTVRAYPAPMTEAEFEVYLRGETAPVADTFQVAMFEGGFLVVRDTAIVAWVPDAEPDLPILNNLGHPMAAADAAAAAADAETSGEHRSCETCAMVRREGPDGYRAFRAAEQERRLARRDEVRAERLAQRARGNLRAVSEETITRERGTQDV